MSTLSRERYRCEKLIGIHWTTKVYKQRFKKAHCDDKPKVKKQFAYDGVTGMLLPASFGSPSALCTKIYEETLDGLSLRTTLLNAKRLKNPMELDYVYERMKKE